MSGKSKAKILENNGLFWPVGSDGRPLTRKPVRDIELARLVMVEHGFLNQNVLKPKEKEADLAVYVITCREMRKQFRSIRHASAETGVNRMAIYKALHSGRPDTVKGWHWKREETKDRTGWVYSPDLGITFKTITAAAEHAKVSNPTLKRAIQSGKPINGNRWGIVGQKIPEWKEPKKKCASNDD